MYLRGKAVMNEDNLINFISVIMKRLLFWCLALLPWIGSMAKSDAVYNITWDSPSQNALGSMPLSGRHGAGANVWVEDGSIWLYLAHSGAYDEQGRLLKLGCLRITPQGLRLGGAGFRQTLDLPSGGIAITQKGFSVTLCFVDQTLVIASKSDVADRFTVAFGSWRDKALKNVRTDMNNTRGDFSADHFMMNGDAFVWCHNNADNRYDVVASARSQGISLPGIDAVTADRVSGGALVADGGLSDIKTSLVSWQYWDGKAWTGTTRLSKKHTLVCRIGAAPHASTAAWEAEAKEMLLSGHIAKAEKQEQRLWDAFWSRSHVTIDPEAGEHDNGFLIGRNYRLFRYMLACNRNGELPLLFNGGIFTVDNKPGWITGNNNNELPISEGGPVTPDFRRWMYCHFMSQNQRWLGWPTIANGDEDLLSPSMHFYRDRSQVAAARAHENGAVGVVYPEPLDVWGLCCVAPLGNGLCGADHLTYHFSMMLEHAWMALQAHDVLGVDISKDLGWITGTVKFYDSYYRMRHKMAHGTELGDDGRLVIYPGNGLELAKGATNQIEAVSALKRIVGALLTLDVLPDSDRTTMERIQKILPDVPVGVREGKKSLLPAKSWEQEYNKWEPIEMYAAWPYRIVGVTNSSTLQLARDTWETVPEDRARLCKQDYSWMANLVNMAALAWPEEAEKRAVYKMANNTAPQARFPAFFGPGHDWLPDHNWGGSGTTGIQEMLLASNPYGDGKIYLLYAWPKKWDVDFKLHTTRHTTVEATVRKGKVVSLRVTPKERMKDVVINPDFR
jgi:hypothetical protein